MTAPDSEQIKLGPPNLRTCDKERMGLTNCFALSTDTGQFASSSVGCHSASNPASPFPRFPNVHDDSIILYQYKRIWTIDLNDYDCNTAWNFSFSMYKRPCLQQRPLSLRQNKLRHFIANRRAEWGRKSTFVTATKRDSEIDAGNWTSSDAAHAHYIVQITTMNGKIVDHQNSRSSRLLTSERSSKPRCFALVS
jgi:hypothetical protein